MARKPIRYKFMPCDLKRHKACAARVVEEKSVSECSCRCHKKKRA